MAYFDKYGVEYSEKGKTIRFPKNVWRLSEEIPKCDVLDLTECVHLELREHDLQNCVAQTIMLPSHVEVLPFYALSRCRHLRRVEGGNIKEIKFTAWGEGALYNCPLLERIQFSREISDEEIRRQVAMLKLDAIDMGRHGIVIASDNEFSYIWSFNVRKFYYTAEAPELFGKFVVFKHPFQREINISEGVCEISYSNEWYIDDIENKSKDIYWHPYPGFSEQRTEDGLHSYYVDLQTEAVRIYMKLEERLKKPMGDVIREINSQVDELDIISIIDSFRTTYSYKIHDKVGGDVREDFFVGRSSFYNDAYLESLLPTYRNHSAGTGYGYSLSRFTQEEMDFAQKVDAEYRERAKVLYDKETHKRYLVDEYIRKIQSDAKYVEMCLNIEAAKRMLKKTSHLKGLDKISELNNHINI